MIPHTNDPSQRALDSARKQADKEYKEANALRKPVDYYCLVWKYYQRNLLEFVEN